MKNVMPKPCAHCPFRRDVEPFLHPDHAADIAYSTQNRYSDFDCHKTIEHDEETGEGYSTNRSKTCAGFYAMKINEGAIDEPPSYVWPDNVYADMHEMTFAYDEAWEAKTA